MDEKVKFQRESWVPLEAWMAFDEMRQSIARRFPWTERAKKLIQNRLWELRQEGHDPRAVLEQSVMMGWRGVFPLKESLGARSYIGQGPQLTEEQMERVRERLAARKAAN